MAKLEQNNHISFSKIVKRLILVIIILVIIIVLYFTEAYRAVDFDKISLLYAGLEEYVELHPFYSIIAALLIYISATAISLPISWLLSVTVGLIFGWLIGSIIVVFGATIGASLLFLIARYAFADFFKRRAGGVLNKMADGFKDGAISYLLFLRLVPAVPFTLVNVVPGILNVKFTDFVLTTFVGIIPGVFVYTYAGEGLRSIVEIRAAACKQGVAPCGEPLLPSDIITKEILLAFIFFGIVALIPIGIKFIKSKREKANGND